MIWNETHNTFLGCQYLEQSAQTSHVCTIYVCFLRMPQGFSSSGILPMTFYHIFCSTCTVTIVIFRHLFRSFNLVTYLLYKLSDRYIYVRYKIIFQ